MTTTTPAARNRRPANKGANRRLIVKIQRRGGVDNDARLERHTRLVLGKLLSTRMVNTIRVTIKVRAGLAKDRVGECHWRNMAKGSTARSKHYTIVIQRDRPLTEQLSTLTHELKHLEQMARGRLTVRRTYGVLGFFWRPVGHTGAAIKYDIVDRGDGKGAQCVLPWHRRPWEIEAMAAEKAFARYAR